jgi:hypothetical protein
MNDFGESIIQTAFPQISKFISSDKAKGEDRASSKVSDIEDRGTPNRRSSQNSVNSEMISDSLDAIEDRIKTGNIILVSQLEQQTQTNKLLGQLIGNGSGMGGNGSGSSGGSGGGSSILGEIGDALGLNAVANFLTPDL